MISKLFLPVCCVFLALGLSVFTQTPILQTMPSSCHKLDHCPDYYSDAEWEDYTKWCCSDMPTSGLVFHCQEHDGHVVSACLFLEHCQPGEYVVIVKRVLPSGSYTAYLEHRACEAGMFERNARESVEIKYPTCSLQQQRCLEIYGKTLASAGNASTDNRCQCLWKAGFRPDMSRQKCTDPAGFIQHDSLACICTHFECPPGQNLNHEYRCVSAVMAGPHSVATSLSTPTATHPTETSKALSYAGNRQLIIISLVFSLHVIFEYWEWVF